MTQIQAYAGQSNYDINLQVYGNLNYFVSFLNQNGITKSNQVLSVYIYDLNLKNINSNNVVNKLLTGFAYATLDTIGRIPHVPLLDNDDSPLLDNDGQELFDN